MWDVKISAPISLQRWNGPGNYMANKLVDDQWEVFSDSLAPEVREIASAQRASVR